jgi:hypothetical protein
VKIPKITIALTIIALTACGKAPRPVPVEGHPLSERPALQVTAASLAHRPIDDLLILVFREGGDGSRWQQVFTDATTFSNLRARGRALAALGVEEHATEISDNNRDIITVLTRLSQGQTAFLLQLSSAAGCAFGAPLDETHLAVSCDEDVLDGIPRLEGIAEVTVTRRNGREISPAVRLRLRTDEDSVDQGQFALSADLVPEIHDGILSFKGTVIVDEGGYFLSEGHVAPHHPYGFSEMSLRGQSPPGE